MHIYILVAAAIIMLSSTILLWLLKKHNVFNIGIILAMMISSIAVCLIFPFILGWMTAAGSYFPGQGSVIIPFLITAVIYITLIFLLSIIISLILPDEKLKDLLTFFKESAIAERLKNPGKIFFRHAALAQETGMQAGVDAPTGEEQSGDPAAQETDDFGGYLQKEENIFEKSVDTGQNIDKMGIEEIAVTESLSYGKHSEYMEHLTDGAALGEELSGADSCGAAEKAERPELYMDLGVEACIEEAFRLKENNDPEGAILYYMYALEKKPGRDLVFWIILDICVLYKSLGQVELAKEILESYVTHYGDVMDETVKTEIERNLS